MELAPGFYVDDLLPAGKVYRFGEGMFFRRSGPAVALSEHDWNRIPAADRERLLDELTRADAQRGQALLERHLRALG